MKMNNKWKIATCNVRGINVIEKLADVIEFHKENHHTITTITETRIKDDTIRAIKNKFKDIIIYGTSNSNDVNGTGTSIIIN